ncbi:MAG: enoyl-CoA hydratase [Rhodospirillaceae bacterium]|nr:enoyl-CoA hydratase [Rhodospirillaceae bacterium]|tara:strand:- start:3013 stop:3774 length:762 start_codon:yes stop_codon:yes gene_type:complete
MKVEESVLIEYKGSLATVVINRPEKLNALNKDAWERIGSAFTELSQDDEIRCIVLRGAGNKALGPGADIKEFETERADSRKAAEYGFLMHQAMMSLLDCRHPIIVRIQGLCIGGALELASVGDLRIASENSQFGIPVNRLGLVMSHYELSGLINLVGKSVALEILLEGRIFDAKEAMEKGLLTRVVKDNELDKEVDQVAARICSGAPLVNRWHKKFASRIVDGIREGRPLSSDELREGYRAFLEKRDPIFEGK